MEERLSVNFSRKDLRKLLIPLVIEQLLAITVGLADSLMVAQVGEAAVSAVSLVDSVNILLINVFAALGTGGAVVAGQFIGRREMEKANRSAMQLLLFMLEVSVGITILVYLLKGFILNVVFGDIEPDVAAYCNTYFMIVEGSTPFLAIYSAGAALFRVMGNASISMKVSLVMNTVNVVGNGILVFGLHRGVEGVAIPTFVSRVVAAVLMVVLLRNPKLPLHLEHFQFHHEKVMIKNILLFGVPNGVENSMFQLGKILLLSVVSALGTASVAANAICNTICNFQILPGQAIGLGMVTVVARCVGAGDYDRARYYTRKLMRYTYIFMLLSCLLVLFLMPFILDLYNASDEASGYAMRIIQTHTVTAILIWPLAALRAAGDTRFTMLTSSVSMWLFRVMLGVAMVRWMDLGVVGIWYAMFVDWAVRMVIFVIRYRGHRWEISRLQDE
jgi:putative MATE family efflux protein